MKTNIALLLLSILFLFSCTDSLLEQTDEYVFDIQISEVPIILNQNCLAKSIKTKLLSKSSKKDLKMEVYLDSTYLNTENLETNKKLYRIDFPEKGTFKNLKILIKKEKQVLEEKVFPIKYVNQYDEVEFTQFNLSEMLPVHFLERGCWPDYKGATIPASENLELSTIKVVKTEIRKNNFRRTITLKDVKLKNRDDGEIVSIDPEVSFTFGGINYLDLEPSVVTQPTDDNVSEISHSIKAFQKEKGFDAGKNSISYTQVYSSDGKHKPSYTVIGFEYGTHIKAKVLDCNQLDTLSTYSIIVPEFIQVELFCED